MNRFLVGLAAWFVVASVGLEALRAPLAAAATNMLVPRDTDSFDPGLAVGQAFPAIRARYQDREITNSWVRAEWSCTSTARSIGDPTALSNSCSCKVAWNSSALRESALWR
jgi:hypothetical protein